MITNITPIEALKDIKAIIDANGDCNYCKFLGLKPNGCGCDEKMLEIITQALAPQECDVNECRHYSPDYLQDDGSDCEGGFGIKCKDIKDCYYKQLHSQKNTFTQYEVRDILNCVLLDYLNNPSVDAYRLDVLKQFEKAVE